MGKKEVMIALFNFLTEQKRISLTLEQFDLLLDSFLMELETRLNEPKKEKVKKEKNRIDIKVSKPLSEEELEFLELYMDDYNWTIKFEGEFPKDYMVPLYVLLALPYDIGFIYLQDDLIYPLNQTPWPNMADLAGNDRFCPSFGLTS